MPILLLVALFGCGGNKDGTDAGGGAGGAAVDAAAGAGGTAGGVGGAGGSTGGGGSGGSGESCVTQGVVCSATGRFCCPPLICVGTCVQPPSQDPGGG
jgi:hypothetical protein